MARTAFKTQGLGFELLNDDSVEVSLGEGSYSLTADEWGLVNGRVVQTSGGLSFQRRSDGSMRVFVVGEGGGIESELVLSSDEWRGLRNHFEISSREEGREPEPEGPPE